MLRPQRPVVLLLLLVILGLSAWWVHQHQCEKWRSCQVSCRMGAVVSMFNGGKEPRSVNCDARCAPEISWLPVGCP